MRAKIKEGQQTVVLFGGSRAGTPLPCLVHLLAATCASRLHSSILKSSHVRAFSLALILLKLQFSGTILLLLFI